jgi:hypothetical protein
MHDFYRPKKAVPTAVALTSVHSSFLWETNEWKTYQTQSGQNHLRKERWHRYNKRGKVSETISESETEFIDTALRETTTTRTRK